MPSGIVVLLEMTNLHTLTQLAQTEMLVLTNLPQTCTLQPWSFSCRALATAAALANSDSGRVRHRLSSSLVRSLVRSHAWRQFAMNLRGMRGDNSCSAALPRESRSDLLSWFSLPSWLLKLSLCLKLELLLSFMLLCLLAVFSFKPDSMSSAAFHILQPEDPGTRVIETPVRSVQAGSSASQLGGTEMDRVSLQSSKGF